MRTFKIHPAAEHFLTIDDVTARACWVRMHAVEALHPGVWNDDSFTPRPGEQAFVLADVPPVSGFWHIPSATNNNQMPPRKDAVGEDTRLMLQDSFGQTVMI